MSYERYIGEKLKSAKKLYLIGLDSVPLWLLEELKGTKGCGAIADFLSEGKVVEMESTLPPITGPAWPSIYTGLAPPDHGVPDFFAIKRDYSPDVVFYDPYKYPPFWEALAESGLKCLVVTPATDTDMPKSKNIDMITGFPLESKPSGSGVERMMRKHGFSGEPDVEHEIKEGRLGIAAAAKILEGTVRKRVDLSIEMMESQGYDFVFVCFTETDRLQHFVLGMGDYRKRLVPIYREAFRLVDYVRRRAKAEQGAVMLASDHGAQPIRSKFLLNQFLMQEGYITLGKEAAAAQKGLASKPKAERFARVHLLDYDMRGTKAFGAVSYDPVATIWINDGRFSKGAVARKERVKLKLEIIRALKGVKSREGDPVFVDVFDADPYYHGTRKFIAPDIFAQAKRGYTVDIFNLSPSSLFMPPEAPKSGDHIRHGIFGVYPRDVGIACEDFSVLNVAPTILQYFGKRPPGKTLRNSRYRAR